MNIVIIGHVCIDENKTEKSAYRGAGSPAMFMNRIFSQMDDVSLSIIAPYGPDFNEFSKEITLYPKTPSCEHTLVYQNITSNGKRIQNAFHRDTARPVLIDDQMKHALEKADVLMLAVLLPNYSVTYIQEVLSYVTPQCLKVLSPQGYFRSFTKSDRVIPRTFKEREKLLPLFDLVILSEEDYLDIEQLSVEWVKNLQTQIIITKADRGADIVNAKGIIEIPTNAVKEVVDSTGAGDVFTAACSYQYRKTKSLVNAIKFAHKIAGHSVRFTPDNIDIRKLLV